MADVFGFIPESMARAICQAAINEERCSEMLEWIFEGGSATIHSLTRRLVLTSKQLGDLTRPVMLANQPCESIHE